MTTTCYSVLAAPVGEIVLTGHADGTLTGLLFGAPEPRPDWVHDDAPFAEARRQVDEYFAHERTEFDLPLAPSGTPFQQQVWQALLEIPFGTTTTYGAIAERLGRPTAVRAVGAANGRNPIGLIVPCHRVIGAGGKLIGYAGGLNRKAWLLDHERGLLPPTPLPM